MILYASRKTHIDSNINSEHIIESPGYDFFRRDRNAHGGGILIATKQKLHATKLDLVTYDLEIVVVALPPKTVLCCLYRPHVSLNNVNELDSVISQIYRKLPGHHTLIVGDLNLPGINWEGKRCVTTHNSQIVTKRVSEPFPGKRLCTNGENSYTHTRKYP